MPRLLVLSMVLMLAAAAIPAWAGPLELGPQPAEGVASIKVGELEILVIEDKAARMDIELFNGPLSREEREALLPDGYAPASVNVLVVKAPDQTILIDSGYGSADQMQGRMLERLAAAGIAPESIDRVILTHLHFDHISGLLNQGKAVFPNAKVQVAAPELAFWQGPDLLLSEGFLKDNAQLVNALVEAYAGRISSFEHGFKVTPLISAVDARGHTPGHTAFLIESGDDRLLVVGDLLHGALIQFPHPDENTEYDFDQDNARLARKAFLNRAAEENLPIVGMHIPWPGAGYVKNEGDSRFLFEPLR